MRDAEAAFRERAGEAERRAAARDWRAAGEAWVEAARIALAANATPSARSALDLAGEAFRRDDRPADAERALQGLLRLVPSPQDEARARVRLAGVLGELGRPQHALAAVADLAPSEASWRAMVVDTRIGLLWQVGRKEQVRTELAALQAAEGPGGIASGFREGQVLRADGDLAGAGGRFTALVERLRALPGAEVGVGAAEAELADLAVLRGEPSAAVPVYAAARERFAAVGRRSLALRAEAGRVRAALEAGEPVATAELEDGARYALDRGLVALELELRLARGAADPDPERGAELLRGVEAAADRSGARLEAGRARLLRGARMAAGPERTTVLERAAADLEDHVPLRDRALAALGGR